MTSKQKTWLIVFLLMFIIPELIWGPIFSFNYQLLHPDKQDIIRENFITDSTNLRVTLFVLIIEIIGIMGLAQTISFKNRIFENTVRTGLVLLALDVALLCYLAYGFRNGLSI